MKNQFLSRAGIPKDIGKFYESNQKFKEYVDKYCTKAKIAKETAFGHRIVQEIFDMYWNEAATKTDSEGRPIG